MKRERLPLDHNDTTARFTRMRNVGETSLPVYPPPERIKLDAWEWFTLVLFLVLAVTGLVMAYYWRYQL